MKKWVTGSGYTIYRVLSGRSNVFLISDGMNNILVDTSTGGNYKQLIRALQYIKCSHISLLILTHTHFDHAANAALLKNKYNLKIMLHEYESKLLEVGNSPIPQGTNYFTKLLVNKISKKLPSFAKYKPVKCDIKVKEKYDINEYGINAFVLHTPGHTSGSISVIVDNEIAIVGDAMFGVFHNSAFPPFADDVEAMVESWGKLLKTGCKIFLPSHGTERHYSLLKSQYKKYKLKYSNADN